MELTFISDGARSVRNTALLEDFFDVCQNPNPAEIALLAEVGRTQEETVREWCKSMVLPTEYVLS